MNHYHNILNDFVMVKNIEIRNSTAEFLIFMLEGKDDGIQVIYKNETIWATQKAMAQLFDVGVPAISKHLKNIFESGELDEHSVISIMARITIRHSIISMPLSVSGIESILFVPLNSGSGVRLYSGSLPFVDMCLIISEWRTGLS